VVGTVAFLASSSLESDQGLIASQLAFDVGLDFHEGEFYGTVCGYACFAGN